MNRFYVTGIDGPQAFFLAGPYPTKTEAEAKVDEVRRIACDFNRNRQAARAAFMGYGVSRLKAKEPGPKSALGCI